MIGRKALGKKTALPQPVRDVYVWANRNVGRLDPRPRVLPNFYVIGTQRGGSTSMFIYLLAHELVHGPRRAKGVHYYDTNFDRSIDWYRGNFPLQSVIDRQKTEHGVDPAVGEGAPYYLFHPTIPNRIHDVTPNARMIVVLREPLARAISHHNHEVARGFETLGLTEAFDAEAGRLAGEEEKIISDPTYVSEPHIFHGYISRGQYDVQLQRYFDVFGRDQVLVLDSAKLQSEPEATVRQATDFLGLPPLVGGSYPQYNKRSHDGVDEAIRAKYGPRFEESNERLRAILEPGTLSWLS